MPAKKKADAEPLKAPEEKVAAAAKELAEKTAEAVKETAAAAKTKASKTATTARRTVKKAATAVKEKMAEPQTTIFVEYQGRQVRLDDLVTAVKHHWGASGQKSADLKSLELYVKPEDSAVYYVANGSVEGKVSF
ncbi:MAG TPA: hypothetical protein IAA56_05085 [Candidatus Galloscillospira excrementavium]|nr:hypothetical protein [Candidatus Galloscillospira excrementavium]